MKKSQKIVKDIVDIKEVVKLIAPEKLERALFLMKYMVETSVDEGRKLVEYSNSDEVTLDMMVAWVKNKRSASLVEVAI